MPNPILPRRSFVPAAVPAVSTDISAPGELVINWADKVAYSKDASGNLITVPLGGSAYALPTASNSVLGGIKIGTGLTIDGSGVVTASGGGGGGSLSGSVTIPASGDQQWQNTVLLLSGNGSLADSSSLNRTVTASGNAAATGAAKFGSASFTFDGDGDFLTVPSATSLDLGDSYTVECWINPASSSLGGGIIHRGLYSGPLESWSGLTLSLRGLGSALRVYFSGTTNANEQYFDVPQSNFPANTWTHLAVVRDGTTGWVYANGVAVGTKVNLNSTVASSQPLYIGQWNLLVEGGSAAFYFQGLIDEVRLTKSVRYPGGTTFTPPTAAFPTGWYVAGGTYTTTTGSGGGGGSLSGSVTIPASGDQYWSNTTLLLKGDGGLTDSSSYARALTNNGGVSVSTSTKKFGTGSLQFTGASGSYLSSTSSDWAMSGDFTIEGWAWLDSSAQAVAGLFSSVVAGENPGGIIISRVDFYLTSNNFENNCSVGWTFPVNEWTHFACVNDNGTLRAYLNGVQQGTAAKTVSVTSTALSIGSRFSNLQQYNWKGFADDLRITAGVCRYPSGTTFTPPAATYVTGPYTASQTLPVTITGSGGGSYTLPTATASVLGGVKVGTGLTITDGVLAASGSGEDTALRAYFLPPAPTSVTATGGNTQAVVSWTAPSVLAQTPITDYVVQYSTNSGSSWTTFSDGTSTATTATVTGLTNGTAYVFRVAAVNGVGTGAYTAATAIVTPGDVFRAIPTMTSLTSPSGEVSGQSNISLAGSEGIELWRAFDGSASTSAQLQRASYNTPSRMIQYAFPSGQKSRISGYSITTPQPGYVEYLDQWVVYGSDDLSAWTEIDSRSGLTTGWASQQARQFNLTQPQNFRAYRWVFQNTTDNGGPNQISTLQLTE